jgi:hypothetical protein
MPRSKFEENVLRRLQVQDIPHVYEPCEIKYTKSYIPDLAFQVQGEGVIYIELKGYLKPEDKTKTVHVLRDHPDLDLRFVFMSKPSLPNVKWLAKHELEWSVYPKFPLTLAELAALETVDPENLIKETT